MRIQEQMSRRGFLATGTAALLAPTLSACLGPDEDLQNLGNPVLTARPGAPTKEPTLGASLLGIGSGRDGLLYVPSGYDPASPAPLVVAFHALGGGVDSFQALYDEADARGFVLLVPESRSSTWDLVRGPFGVDVTFIDQALAYTFDRCAINTSRVAFMGFSDGASYALSLGVSNGDLATQLVGFSPGFWDPAGYRTGRPPIFVSHGTTDEVIPIETSRNSIVPDLRREGYLVEYVEFDGGHGMPPAIVTQALEWFLG